jgi:hypothetical protein
MYKIESHNDSRTTMSMISTAKTLEAAKKECESEFGGGYVDDTLLVLEDGYEMGFIVVAKKSNHPAARWIDLV